MRAVGSPNDFVGPQTLTQGRVRSTNDIIVALAGEDNQTQIETACMYIETQKRLPLNCRQLMAEAISFGCHSRNPMAQARPITLPLIQVKFPVIEHASHRSLRTWRLLRLSITASATGTLFARGLRIWPYAACCRWL